VHGVSDEEVRRTGLYSHLPQHRGVDLTRNTAQTAM
jgi:hypothetical protein